MVSRHRAGALVLFSVGGLAASPAFAGVADCKRIQAPLDRLACYDRLTNAQPASRTAKPLKPELAGLAQAPGVMPAYVGVLPLVDSPGRQWWIEAEQAFYSLSKGHSSPLIVTGDPTVSGPITNTVKIPTSPAFIGLQTTQNSLGSALANGGTLFGGGDGLNTGIHSGESLRFGHWLDAEHTQAIEGGGFFIGQGRTGFSSAPGGSGVGVPFFDANGNGQLFIVNRPATSSVTSVSVNTTPDVFVGLFNKAVTDQSTGIASGSYSQSLWGADLNYRVATPLFRERGVNVNVSAGFRYVNLSESLSLNTESTAVHAEDTTFAKALGLPGNPNFTNSTSTTIATSDAISTHNNFIGPQFGAGGDFRLDERWSISGDAKVAVGANIESLSVSGSTSSTVTSSTTPTTTLKLAGIPLTVAAGSPPGSAATPVVATSTTTSGGGIFASPANSGSHSRTVFAYIPSSTIKLNYDAIPNFLTLSVGYNMFWMSDVLRPTNQLLGTGAPTYAQSSLLAQAVTIGAKVKF
jgi:Putative beta barrel porin-7 (BBP7)